MAEPLTSAQMASIKEDAEKTLMIWSKTALDLLAEVDRLNADRERLRAILESVQWEAISGMNEQPACPMCYGQQTSGHKQGCTLAAVLKG